MYTVGEGSLPWADSFFSKWKENTHFSPHAYCFIFKSDLLNPNFVKKNHILYCFSYKVTFSMSKVNFLMFGFIEVRRLNIDLCTNKN